MTDPQYTIQGTEFDAQFAAICIYLSHAIATAADGNFNNIEERLMMVQEQVVKAMALLPQPMQDEIVALTKAAMANAASG